MSRIGKMPITVPAGVTVTVGEDTVKVKGPKGELTQSIPQGIIFDQDNGVLTVSRPNDSKVMRSCHGLCRALVFNMVKGVTEGFTQALEIQGTGYRAAKAGDIVTLSVGYSHPVEWKDGEGYTLEVPAPNSIVVSGICKQRVGEIAAQIRRVRPPEPYHGKGIRYAGEVVRLKAGKAGAK